MTERDVERIAERVARRILAEMQCDTVEDRIAAAIAALSKKHPEIVRIRYSLGEDQSGSAAVFLRILVSDDLAEHLQWDSRHTGTCARFSRLSRSVMDHLAGETVDNRSTHVSWRSVSEQSALQEKDWE